MKLELRLAWLKPGAAPRRGFRSEAAWGLVSDYSKRASRYAPFELAAGFPEPASGSRLWVCDRERGEPLSSARLAEALSEAAAGGTRVLRVLVGGADGIAAPEWTRLRPDLAWSFGPLTLPHELAAAVAAEQLYRAWTILKREPYHLGHG